MNEKREIGIVGLGKMGGGIARRLHEKGWRVVGFDQGDASAIEKDGITVQKTLQEIVQALDAPRLVWLMVPAGKPVDETLFGKNGLSSILTEGDTVIDGGNSFYKDSAARAKKLEKKGIHFIDVGFSGGPEGARRGGCLMIGGEQKIFQSYESLFKDLSVEKGYAFFSGAGAGHYIKMIHNGIEYGMMQSIAEGFALLKKSKYALDLKRVAAIFDHGSVIESRLIEWAGTAFDHYGDDLKEVSGSVGHTGEGEWSVKVAKEMKIPVPAIEAAYTFRVESAKKPSYIGKVLSALRNQFGGHSIQK